MAFHGRRVALLRLITLLPVLAPAWPSVAPAWPCFAYFASCHAWPSVAAAWPDFAGVDLLCSLFCLLSWPLRGPLWPRVSLLRLLCLLSWPLRGLPWPPRGLASPTLLPVARPCFACFASCHAWPSVTAAWPYFAHFFACCLGPCVALCGPACPCFAYFASCHGPCVAFRGPRVALLCLL